MGRTLYLSNNLSQGFFYGQRSLHYRCSAPVRFIYHIFVTLIVCRQAFKALHGFFHNQFIMEASHNEIRGRSDAFDRIRKTLELLDRKNIKTGAVTSLMSLNCEDLDDLYRFLLEHGVEVWQLQLASAMGNIAGKRESLVSPENVTDITEFIRDKNRERRMVVIAADSIGYFDDNEVYIRGFSSPVCYWNGCAAGISSIFIGSVGNVKGCGALYSDAFIEGNVRMTSLADIWHDKEAFSYNRKFSTCLLAGKCRGCDVGHVCKGGCRSSNYFSSGNLYESAFCCREP